VAKKKPIVLTNGQLEQLQSGDHIDLSNSTTKNNNTGGTLVIGTAVYVSGGNATEAQADAQNTVRVAGLVVDITAPDAGPVEVQADGILIATTGQWDAVTGQTGGLTEGADYFLSEATAGELTTTAPSVAGDFVLRVGHALSATELEIEVAQPIKL
jgi:hypothetical protein